MRMSKRIGGLFLLAVLTACSRQEGTFTIEVKDGVRYVHNRAAALGDSPGIAIEPVKTIGRAETGDDRYLLLNPIDAVAGDAGSLLILDARRPAIRTYDSDGTFMADLGRVGSGPGEFRAPFCLDRDRAGNIYFTDVQNARLGSFSASGDVRPSMVLRSFFHTFRVLSDGRIAGLDLSREEDPMKVARLFDARGDPVGTFGEAYRHEEEFMEFRLNMCTLERDAEDGIYLSFDNHNRIDKYAPEGTLLMRIDRPLPYRVEHGLRRRTTRIEGEEVTEPEPDLTDVSCGVGIDGSGRIWVLTFVTQPEKDLRIPDRMADAPEKMHFEVFAPDGVLLGYVPVPVKLSRFRIFGDRLLLIDAYWDVCVHEYRIVDTSD
jgi:hypothetical protein